MKDETSGAAIEKLFGLKPKIFSFLVDDNNEHKKAKGVNKNVVETISHGEYKGVLLNNKSIRQSMHRIQSKNHNIGIYKINIFLHQHLMIRSSYPINSSGRLFTKL